MDDTSHKKLNGIFKEILELEEDDNLENITRINCSNWDSLANVSLIAAISNEFDIELEISEMEFFTSVKSIKLLLEEKI